VAALQLVRFLGDMGGVEHSGMSLAAGAGEVGNPMQCGEKIDQGGAHCSTGRPVRMATRSATVQETH
jgi:hypothetical protein